MPLTLRARSTVLLKVLVLHIFHFPFAGQSYERQRWPLYDPQKYDTYGNHHLSFISEACTLLSSSVTAVFCHHGGHPNET